MPYVEDRLKRGNRGDGKDHATGGGEGENKPTAEPRTEIVGAVIPAKQREQHQKHNGCCGLEEGDAEEVLIFQHVAALSTQGRP